MPEQAQRYFTGEEYARPLSVECVLCVRALETYAAVSQFLDWPDFDSVVVIALSASLSAADSGILASPARKISAARVAFPIRP